MVKNNKAEKENNIKKSNAIKIIIVTIILMFFLSFFTKYYGSADVGDYSDVAKFFAGDLNAKLRTSHTIAYGLIHAPFVKLTQNFISLKITTIICLLLLILSVYYISNKNKKTLWLFIATPALWFMAPWISPIPLAALLLLWSYFFINKYDKESKITYLIYSGLLIGIAWVFWEAIIYFAFAMFIAFLFNKKTSHTLLFLLMIAIGVLPKLIIDQIYFGYAFYNTLKHFLSVVAFSFYGSIYGQAEPREFFYILPILLVIPIYTLILLKKENFNKYKRQIFFILLSLFMTWLAGSQIRYIFIAIPIIILLLGEILTEKQFKVQMIIFLILSILVINPYLLQIKYEINHNEFNTFILGISSLKISSNFTSDLIKSDLNQIAKEYPNQTFVVGSSPDTYQTLADLYWGKEIKEFVSVQDYNLFLKNNSIVFEKSICSSSPSWNRRDICISASLKKPETDNTDYASINYALYYGENPDIKGFELKDFELIKEYNMLSLYKKK